jgi:hypothetical protein
MQNPEKPTVHEIALGIHAGTIFCDWHLPPSDNLEEWANNIRMCFMPIVFMSSTDFPKDCGLIWEYLNAAGPRSVNGLPSFMSMRHCTQAETHKVRTLLKRLADKDAATTPAEKGRHEQLFWEGK